MGSTRAPDGRPRSSRAERELARLNSCLDANLSFEIVGDARPFSQGVLVSTVGRGAERRASFPVLAAASGRTRLLSLALSLSECAMALGLGASIYGASRAARARVECSCFREST